jgi:hypothetical protein
MQLTIEDAHYRDRLAGHLRSVGFEVEAFGRQQLDVLGLDGDADAGAEMLEPFLRVWARLYPDVDVQVAVRA